jgi:hypothetical protein
VQTQLQARKRSVASQTPSTTLRVVPLSRCAGADEFDRSRDAVSRSFSPRSGEGKKESRSRNASQRPSYATPILKVVTTDFIRCSMPSGSRPMPVEALASAASARMTDGQGL